MGLRKSYKAPFWNMIILVIASIGWGFYLYFLYYRNFNIEISVWNFFRSIIITTTILLIEAIIYWFIRKWPMRKLLIWLHIGSLYIIVVVLPALLAFYIYYISIVAGNNYSVGDKIIYARLIIHWVLVVAGHIFFVAAIIEGYRNRKKLPEQEVDYFESL